MLDRDLVCVDLETTGGNALHHRVIEVGVVRISRDGEIEEWSQLVNPGCRVPAQIEQFTGITNDMVADAPPFEAIARDLYARLQGHLFVAHNARFDYGFLRNEFARLDLRFRAPVLCTVKLSRRLFPEARRHNLDAIVERHGLVCTARHRALGDALVLRDFLALVEQQIPGERLQQVVATLLQQTALPPQLPPDLLDELPESPGVYRFFGSEDALLYVGKAKNLRSRVLEHFAGDHRSTKELQLSRQVQRVDWAETAGEFSALLKESQWVKAQRPQLNRRLKPSLGACTIRLVDGAGGHVQASIEELENLAGADLDEIYGLFRERKDAKRALEELIRAHRLCARELGLESGPGSCFAYQLQRCKGVCVGVEPPALHAARARIALSSTRIHPWPFRGRIAIRERDWRGEEEYHLFDRWTYLGSAASAAELETLARVDMRATSFDIDAYRLLNRYLASAPAGTVIELQKPN